MSQVFSTHGARAKVEDEWVPQSASMVIIKLLLIVVPFLGLIAAMGLLWGRGFTPVDLGLFVGFYLASVLGVTVGFHRLFTHRSFDTGPRVKAVLGAMGSMAAEGPILDWVATHRLHHQHSDEEHDPHSPRSRGGGLFGTLRGLYHGHIGWFFTPDPVDLKRYAGDLQKSRLVRTIDALFPVWLLLSLGLPALIAGLITMSWSGALGGLVWGGLVRMFVVHHVTWSVNSMCHMWGARPFRTSDDSRNNWIVGLLALGEGWHNNHHAFATSARHGLAWWQIDVSYWVIRLMEACGLAWNVKVPPRERLEAKRRRETDAQTAMEPVPVPVEVPVEVESIESTAQLRSEPA